MKPFEGDSRYILRKNLKKAADRGLTFYTGPEIEFFFFTSYNAPDIIDRGGYFDLTPLDSASDYRRETVLTLEEMGIDVITSHHEGAPSQHEIDLRHEDALTTADNIMTFRIVAKEVAQKSNIYASFMPKPLANQNGSGMHIHMSLFDNNDENIFFDASRPHMLSETGGHFLAGLMRHAPEFFAVTNQWINSYKRFNRGFEAPVSILWSGKDNDALIRVPHVRPDKSHSMRIEIRNPDPACNPYLALSALLAAGLAGIDNKYDLPEHGKPSDIPIPSDLGQAIKLFSESKLMKETFGETVMGNFLANKKIEIERFNSHVTDFEISEYLPIL
ncbi:MAG TPA: glutamine synthetase, partial [Spirochaetota bacterium]|nr:glutamine synthetase [Spirochaetota bacterium]